MKTAHRPLRGTLHFFSETGTEGGYWAFQTKKSPAYDGLHVLENGDMLTIFSKEKPKKVIWSGIIALRTHKLFTRDASGHWIHADQEGIDRDIWARWFFDEHPAKLVPAKQNKNKPRT